jgi:hypothetical protein
VAESEDLSKAVVRSESKMHGSRQEMQYVYRMKIGKNKLREMTWKKEVKVLCK